MSAPRGPAAVGGAGSGAAVPVVAIIGRPNAGKSTFFNRLCGTRRALVDAEPGVTRDRNVGAAQHQGRRFILVDTGGFDPEAGGDIAAEVRLQTEIAMDEADVIILLVDGRAGLAPGDREVLDRLRRGGRPFWLAVNKLDTPALDDEAAEFFALGVERVIPISSAHGRGIDELMEAVLAGREPSEEAAGPAQPAAVSVGIIGRPNVGKSSLLNRLLGYERAIVTPIPGTTRDAIDTPFAIHGAPYVLVDTAGIRRRPRVHERLERASAVRALRALERSDLAILVADATQGMAEQDARIAGYAWDRGRGLVVAVNRCDLAGGIRAAERALEPEVRRQYPFLADVPLVFVSALRGDGMREVLAAIERVAANHRRELQTSRLNQVISGAVAAVAHPAVRGKRPTFQYAVQTGVRPPSVTIFCSAPQLVTTGYTRYLVNRLRAAFDLQGTPVRIGYRPRHEQAEPRRRRRVTAGRSRPRR